MESRLVDLIRQTAFLIMHDIYAVAGRKTYFLPDKGLGANRA
jgi:hypothetical protein